MCSDIGSKSVGRGGATACLMNFKCDVLMLGVACAGANAAKVSSVDVLSAKTTQNGMQAVTAKVEPPCGHTLSLLCPDPAFNACIILLPAPALRPH